jgi:uncharacterized protein (DUF305 family)
VLCVVLATACGAEPEPNTADKTFVSEMVAHHRLGMTMVESAVLRSDDVRLRKLVFEMESYHGHELHLLSSNLQEWNMYEAKVFPGFIDQIRLAKIDQLTGPAYDKAWILAMIEHHEGAVLIGKNQLLAGNVPDLVSLAKKVVATQEAEIAEMQKILGSK